VVADSAKWRKIMIREVEYFEQAGLKNTDACLAIARRAVEEGVRHIVVASTGGETGLKAARALSSTGATIVVVGHSAGFKNPGENEFSEAMRAEIEGLGARVHICTILTHSIETSLHNEFKGIYPAMIVAASLRRLGQGVKVGCEIVMEACDGGLIPEGEEVIAVAGTARGADTVMIVKSAASKRFMYLKVLEILAKPRV